MLLAAFIAAQPLYAAADCFVSKQQQYIYERGVAPAKENAQITACLLKRLNPDNFDEFDKAAASLRKSNNTAPAISAMMRIFKETKNPRAAFSAAAFLISAPYELAAYEKQLLNILASNTQDYKQTLAVIVLASMESIGANYAPFLTPAIDGKDPVLQAYAAAAYTVIVPGIKDLYLDKIIMLYGFDKAFAQMAFNATGLKDKVLHAALKTALRSADETMRISAIEWAAETNDKTLLNAILNANYDPKDTQTLAAAAQAMVRNMPAMRGEVKKAFKKPPTSAQATIAVMAYSFIGAEGSNDIEAFLKSSNTNEVSNALRVISYTAGILAEDAAYYPNPLLEDYQIKRLIPLAAHIDDTAKNTQVKAYAATAVKELYKLLNK